MCIYFLNTSVAAASTNLYYTSLSVGCVQIFVLAILVGRNPTHYIARNKFIYIPSICRCCCRPWSTFYHHQFRGLAWRAARALWPGPCAAADGVVYFFVLRSCLLRRCVLHALARARVSTYFLICASGEEACVRQATATASAAS